VGIPSVATECGGLPEAVGDGGLLVKSATSVKAWVMATRTLMEDDAQWEELSSLARESSERFRPEVVLARLDALLEPLLVREG
jgi:glycosyltransferase involved in cell wall biosynthesis